jgi:PAS domain S-box-containing protein
MTFKQKENWQRLIDHLPVVVFEYTFFPNGTRGFTYVSPRCEELLGVLPEAIMDEQFHISSFILDDDMPSFNHSIESSVERMSEWSWQGRCRGKDGVIWLETRGTPVKTDDGRILYNGIFSDSTARKRLEKTQVETEQRYRELVENLPLGLAIHSRGKIRYLNAAAARMIGVDKLTQVEGLEVAQFVHPDSRSVVKERVEKVLNGQSVPPVEEKYVRLDGKVIDVEASGYPYSYLGEPAVQVIFSDITERKNAEASLRKSETLFSQMFQNTPMAVTLLNEEGNVVRINKGFEEMFGFSVEELEGKGLNQFIVPDDLESEGNDLNTIISSNRVVKMETIRHRKDKTILSVIIYGVPVLLEDQTIGIFGMYVDITERRKVEEELKIRNTELDNFVYKVSHDLRAPLSSVLGLVHLAGLPGNNDSLADYLKLVGQKAEQLDHFISDVLSHSKNLKMELKIEEVDFQKTIDQTFNGLNYLKGAEAVETDVKIAVSGFYSDPWRIAEIFRNLVSNAIKYRKLTADRTRIGILIEQGSRSQCNIVFSDDGIGIGKDNLEKIFEMFYRASAQSDGSGLGLYIVKNAIEKLGGTIKVESEPGKGTTFKISLPNQRLVK